MFVPLALHELSDGDLRQLQIAANVAVHHQPVAFGALYEAVAHEAARRRGEHRVYVGGIDLTIGSPDADPELRREARREAAVVCLGLRGGPMLPEPVQDVFQRLLEALDDDRRRERAEVEQLTWSMLPGVPVMP